MNDRGVYKAVAGAALVVSGALVVASCGAADAPVVARSTTTGASAAATPSATTPSAPPTPTVTEPPKTQDFKPLQIASGRFMVTDFAGPTSGVTMKVWVWLPPQYDDPAYANKRFPVIYGFPGGEGIGYTAWFMAGQTDLITAGAKDGSITPFVIVEPELQVSIEAETECTDLPGHPRVGTFMDTDVPDMMAQNFRVLTDRTAWGLAGSSTGAYCAAKYLLHRPEKWSAAVMHSPYFTMDSHLKAGQTKDALATSPSQWIKRRPAPDVKMLAFVGDVGAAERNSMEYSRAFAKDVVAPATFELRHVPGGKHSWDTYKKHNRAVFEWFTQHLDKPH